MPRIFLSYARRDDERFVHRLRDDLVTAGFTVWFDRDSLMSRGLTFHQEIKDAIREEVDRIVYVGGPNAAISPYVREEWQLALHFDHVVVTPILRLGDYETSAPGELGLLHCEDFRDDGNYASALGKLIANLKQPNPKLGALHAVPNLPPNFLARPDLMRRVRDALLVDLQKPQVITGADAKVGMQGMGGIGKSVLAVALARNREVRQSYPDGVVWVACGQNLTQDDLLARLRDVSKHLGGGTAFQSLAQAQSVLRDLLHAKAVLLLLDDVWHAKDAQAFDSLGPRCLMLVTTRDAGILHTLHGEHVPVSLFTETESLQLLADTISTKDRPVSPADLPVEARHVVRECGCLPLAVALSGGMARKHGGNFRSVLERLRRADLDKIADREAINEQHRSIWRAMQASVEMLNADERRRFTELSVFETDGTVPEAAAATLWEHVGKLDRLDTEDLLSDLFDRSLIQLDRQTDSEGVILRRFRLHDLLHDFAVRIGGDRRVLHRNLLDAYRAKCPDGWHSGPNDGYYLQHICRHLAEAAGNWDEAAELLCELRFIDARCRVGQIFDLIGDYRMVRDNLPEAQEPMREERERDRRVQRWTDEIIAYARGWSEIRDRIARGEAATNMEPVLPEPPPSCQMWTEAEMESECSRILNAPTRLDRFDLFAKFVSKECYSLHSLGSWPGFVLQHAYNSASAGVVHEAARLLAENGVPGPLLLRCWPTEARFNPRPALLLKLEGHDAAVTSVSITADGRRAVSGSEDSTVRLWDLESGSCLLTLRTDGWGEVLVRATPDGRRAVAADNSGVYVWDLESGARLETLKDLGFGGVIVDVTPDARLAVTLDNCSTMVRVWDLESGVCLSTLDVPSSAFDIVSVTPDGQRAVFVSGDGTLQLWDLESGKCLWSLEGDSDNSASACAAPDGRLAVIWTKQSIRVVDIEGGVCLQTWGINGLLVNRLSVTPDGRRTLTVDYQKVVCVWDLESGTCLDAVFGHDLSVSLGSSSSIGITPDGRRAVTGGRNTVLVWDFVHAARGRFPEGHSGMIYSSCFSPDGRRLVSAGGDNALRVWDLESGVCLRTLEGHSEWIGSLSISPDARRAVAATVGERMLRVWDLESGVCLRTIEEHSDLIGSLSISPDARRLVSAGGDNALRVWDLESGVCLRTLEGHSDSIHSLSISPDGRHAVSGASDNALRVWDLESGVCLRTLEGHSGWIGSLSISPDGRRLVSAGGDNALRVWDLEPGVCLWTLEGHSDWMTGSLSISPDGRRLVSAGRDNALRVWDLESGVCLRTLEGHSKGIRSLSISPDGRYAVSGSEDNTLRVWNLAKGECVAFYHARSEVGCVLFSPHDGRILCCTGAGETAGQMHFLRPIGFPPSGPPVVTAVRLWRFGENGAPGRWDDHLTVLCPWCGQCFAVSDEMPGRQIPCPSSSCAKPLQLNPFVVDHSV